MLYLVPLGSFEDYTRPKQSELAAIGIEADVGAPVTFYNADLGPAEDALNQVYIEI